MSLQAMCCLLDGDDRDQVHFRLSGETSLSTTHHQNLKVCKSEKRAYRWLSIVQNIVMNLLSFCLWGWSVHETRKNECVCVLLSIVIWLQSIIKALHGSPKPPDSRHYLYRSDQVIIFRHRTGHSATFTVSSPMCSCGDAK